MRKYKITGKVADPSKLHLMIGTVNRDQFGKWKPESLILLGFEYFVDSEQIVCTFAETSQPHVSDFSALNVDFETLIETGG